MSIGSSFEALAQSIPLKIIQSEGVNTNNGRAVLKLKELIDAKFPSKFNINIVNSSKISTSAGELDAINLGAAELALVNIDSAHAQTKQEQLLLLQIPYLFITPKEFKIFLNSKLNNEILESLSKTSRGNVVAVALWPGEKKYWFSKKNIEDIKDLEGKKITGRNNEIAARFIKTMGGEPVLFSSADNQSKQSFAYETADIIEDTPENILREKNKYAASTIIESFHTRDLYVIYMNKAWLNNLPPNVRQLFLDTIKDVGVNNLEIYDKNESKEIEAIKTNFSVNTFTPNKWEQAEFFQAGQMVQKYYTKNINSSLIEKSKLTLTNQYR